MRQEKLDPLTGIRSLIPSIFWFSPGHTSVYPVEAEKAPSNREGSTLCPTSLRIDVWRGARVQREHVKVRRGGRVGKSRWAK